MKIVTSLSFRGQCREAFEFYAKVLGGRITAAHPYGEGPPDMPMDAKYKDWLMHCWLEVGDQALMGADMDEPWAPNIGKPKPGYGSLTDRFGIPWMVNVVPTEGWKPAG